MKSQITRFAFGANTGITSTATTGTATNSALASSNPGQIITVNGSGLTTATDLIGRYSDESGNLRIVVLNPTSSAADGSTAQVFVPSYFNGAFGLFTPGASTAPLLQIVPVVTGVDFSGASSTRWQGFGFVEGSGTIYSIGPDILADVSTNSGPDVYYTGGLSNSAAYVSLTFTSGATAVITTAGGTSAPVSLV